MKQIGNWLDRAIKASELNTDHRFKKWAKIITKVNQDKTDGYAFEGPFLKDGTTELDISKQLVILVASETGSMKYRTTSYQVVTLNKDGEGIFDITDINTTDSSKGWALRIRDKVAALLGQLNNTESGPKTNIDQEIINVKRLREIMPDNSILESHIKWLESLNG